MLTSPLLAASRHTVQYNKDLNHINSRKTSIALLRSGIQGRAVHQRALPKATVPQLKFRNDRVEPGFWCYEENRKQYLRFLVDNREALGLLMKDSDPLSCLYYVTRNLIINTGGSGLLKYYNGSVSLSIMSEFPNHKWLPWKFSQAPRNWWDNIVEAFFKRPSEAIPPTNMTAVDYIREYLAELAHERNIASLADWESNLSNVTKSLSGTVGDRINQLGGLHHILQVVYPHHEWRFLKEEVQISGLLYTEDINHSVKEQRNLLDKIARHFACDMYDLTADQLQERGGYSMLQLYSNSVALAVMTLYPEITWSPWKFLSQGKSKWLSLITKIKDIQATSNRFDPVAATSLLMYFQELEKSLAINNVQEWNDFLDPNPAKVLPTKVQTDLDKIGGLVVALSLAYPWVEWPPDAKENNFVTFAKFPSDSAALEHGFWNIRENRRKYLNFLKEQLGGSYEDLYQCTFETIRRTGGSRLLNLYGNSPARAIMSEFPEHEWKAWKFARSPRGWWRSLYLRARLQGDQKAKRLIVEYIDDLSQELGLRAPEDWLLVPHDRLSVATQKRLRWLGGLQFVLRLRYPNHPWGDFFKGKSRRQRRGQSPAWTQKKSERLLKKTAEELLPHQ